MTCYFSLPPRFMFSPICTLIIPFLLHSGFSLNLLTLELELTHWRRSINSTAHSSNVLLLHICLRVSGTFPSMYGRSVVAELWRTSTFRERLSTEYITLSTSRLDSSLLDIPNTLLINGSSDNAWTSWGKEASVAAQMKMSKHTMRRVMFKKGRH